MLKRTSRLGGQHVALERGEVAMPDHADVAMVVERRLADSPPVEREAARLDKVEDEAEAGAQAQCGTEIVGPVGLEQGQAQGGRQPAGGRSPADLAQDPAAAGAGADSKRQRHVIHQDYAAKGRLFRRRARL